MSRRSPLRIGSLGIAGLLVWSVGCAPVGPDYKRPDLLPPVQHRWAENTQSAATLADTPWWQVFDDDALQALIRDAVVHNLDLRVALARVQESRALAGVAKSFLYPEINLTAGYTGNQASRNSQPPGAQPDTDRTFNNSSIGASVIWEADLFGRLRRNNEAAFDRYLASEEGRRAVLVTVVSDVATSYFLLRQLDLQLDIAKQTLAINDQTVSVLHEPARWRRVEPARARPGASQPVDHRGVNPGVRTADRPRRTCDQRARRPRAWR